MTMPAAEIRTIQGDGADEPILSLGEGSKSPMSANRINPAQSL